MDLLAVRRCLVCDCDGRSYRDLWCCTSELTATFDYGLNGAEAGFPAFNCFVIEAHSAINCTTAAGAGYNIEWILTIGNQTSLAPVTGYG